MKNRSSKILFAALVGLALTGALSAFVLLDPPRTWDNAAPYVVDNRGLSSVTDGDGGVSAVVQAINSNQAWNGSGNGTLVAASAGSVANFVLGDGIPMLNFQDPVNACKGSCLAATFIGFFEDRNDGSVRIFDADIVTNSGRFNFTTEGEPDGCSSEFFIEGIQVHEVGHGLGLGHTDVSGATMFPSVSSCNNGPATIEADDEAGIDALYGGGGGPGGGNCELGQKGDSCSSDADCCSGKCRGATPTCK